MGAPATSQPVPILSSELVDVYVEPSGFVVFRYRDGASVSGPAALSLLTSLAHLVRDPRPTLADIRNVRKIDTEARHAFSSGEINRSMVSRIALLTGSPMTRMIGNFFLGMNRPSFPTRLFSDEAAARQWLSQT